MDECEVNSYHKCGTVHCHAGWYAVAACKLEYHISYIDGAVKMAKDLGFRKLYLLEDWAAKNPKLWGNKYGDVMFFDKKAFNHPTKRRRGP